MIDETDMISLPSLASGHHFAGGFGSRTVRTGSRSK